jgi:hypothetical protein
MFAKTTSKDLGTALGVTLVGGALLLFALRAHWVPADLNPGIEGCLTATIVGFLMALLHRMPYGQALALSALPTAAQYVVCVYAAGGGVGLAITGIQLVVMGLLGLMLAAREPRPAQAASEASHVHTHSHTHAVSPS